MRTSLRGLTKKPNSNRVLAKRFKNLNKISFCNLRDKFIIKVSALSAISYDTHDLFPTSDNYIYRAIINDNFSPFDSINRIKCNPNPQYMSRANIRGQGIAYYTCSPDISIIEGCREKLRTSLQRDFNLTVSKWKIKRQLSIQIVCNSLKAQSSGTDLKDFCLATNRKRKKDLKRKDYRTYFLKSRFIADQYTKGNINCEQDYIISAIHSKTILNSKIDGIIYPSVQYLFKGFNYAFPPRLFEDSYFELMEVAHIKAKFDHRDISKYPVLTSLQTTQIFDGDKIIWK